MTVVKLDTKKNFYWGITQTGLIMPIATGTFADVWKKFVELYGAFTLKQLHDSGIKISRIK